LVYYLSALDAPESVRRPELMLNKNRDGKPKQSSSNVGEPPAPPFLSEKLIAQLQGAVEAAQRKRMTHPADTRENRSAEKDF
jgi:hypothetical protein